MSYYPPSSGFPGANSQQPFPFGGAVYDPFTSPSGYPQAQANVSMPEPFGGGLGPSYPVPGSGSSLPGHPQSYPGGYMGASPVPGMVSQPPVAMPSYQSSQMGSCASYPPQPSYPPAFASSASVYPPAMGPGLAGYGVPGGPVGAYSMPPAMAAQPCVAVQSAYQYTSAVPVGTSLVQGHGTIRPHGMLSVEEDCKVLRKAMKGFGTDEKTIIDLISRRTNGHRQQIRNLYKTMYGRDLVHDLSSELSFKFKQTVLALMMSPAEYDAEELNKAIRYLGTDEETLVEILCTRTNQQLNEIKFVYRRIYSRELEHDLIGDTSGHFRRLVVALSTGGRREDGYVDIQRARMDAMELYQAGERRWGTDESKFNQILCSQSHAQLRAVFEEYKRVAHRTIEQSLRNEMSGDLLMGMLAIVSVVLNPRRYFADRLHRALRGVGTNDDALIRVVVSRSEVDLVEIKHEFQYAYGQTLEAFIADDTSGDYKKMLLAVVRGY